MTKDEAMIEEEALINDYFNIRWLDFRGIRVLCGLYRFAFTTGLVIGIDMYGYFGRWCFTNTQEARNVILSLDKIPDDLSQLPGEWIKYKGREGEISHIKDIYDKETSNAELSETRS